MRHNWQKVLMVSVMVLVLGAPALLAQKYEVNPYAGFYWPTRTSVGQLKDSVILGVRGGVFLDPNFELEGQFGYINQFEVRGFDPKSRGHLWELAGDYNFSAKEWPVVRAFTPFVVIGAGAVRTHLEDPFTFTTGAGVTSTPFGLVVNPGRSIQMSDGNTFFTVSYGGGFKSIKVAGPIGLRFDVRGRTMPNYYHTSPTWLEVTGGINVMWGEK
jgi:hypothetical protein